MAADTPIALTIAGSDPSGGAGLQADLKTFAAFDVYGAAVVTALTAQDTIGVRAVADVPPAFVAASVAGSQQTSAVVVSVMVAIDAPKKAGAWPSAHGLVSEHFSRAPLSTQRCKSDICDGESQGAPSNGIRLPQVAAEVFWRSMLPFQSQARTSLRSAPPASTPA